MKRKRFLVEQIVGEASREGHLGSGADSAGGFSEQTFDRCYRKRGQVRVE